MVSKKTIQATSALAGESEDNSGDILVNEIVDINAIWRWK